MGAGGSKTQSAGRSQDDQQRAEADLEDGTLTVRSRADIVNWGQRLAEIAGIPPEQPASKRQRGRRGSQANDASAKKPLRPLPTIPTDDGTRVLICRYRLNPKDANQLKRTIGSSCVNSVVVRAQDGGPRLGYRDDIQTRTNRAIGNIATETAISSLDLSQCDIGGRSDNKHGRTVDPVSVTGNSVVSLCESLQAAKQVRS